MFRCVRCLTSKGCLEELTFHVKEAHYEEQEQSERATAAAAATMEVMKEATRRLKKKRREKKRQTAAGDGGGERERDLLQREEGEEEEREREWVAEVERGILLTLVSEPGGGNRIEKIWFRKDIFDASEAQQWWTENCDKVLDLYSIHRPHPPPCSRSHRDNREKSAEDGSFTWEGRSYTEYLSLASTSTASSSTAGGAASKREIAGGRLVEWVVEDQPGVFVTVRCSPDGRQALRRVEISRERYGEVKARVWWEENKARLHRQYTRPA